MKQFNIEEIEKNFLLLTEVMQEVRKQIATNKPYYVKLLGMQRQAIHAIVSQKVQPNGYVRGIKPESLIKIYKIIRDDLNDRTKN
jgi:ribulose bisphosphate carboxylase small subunit